MKKPNITENDWVQFNDRVEAWDRSGVVMQSTVIARMADIREMQANRKAIAAVPDMIDALIATVKDNPSVSKEVYDKIEDALEKAGVEL